MCLLRFLLALSFSTVLWADDPQISPFTNLHSDPSGLAYGCVSTITGDYVESHVDISVPGPDSFNLVRNYCSSDKSEGTFHTGWNYNHHYRLQEYSRHESESQIQYTKVYYEGPFGQVLESPEMRDKSYRYTYTSKDFSIPKGTTNTSSGYISGASKFQNFRVHDVDYYKKLVRESDWKVTTLKYHSNKNNCEYGLTTYRAIDSKLLSGNNIHYVYPNEVTTQLFLWNKNNRDISQITLGENTGHPQMEKVAKGSNNTYARYLFRKSQSSKKIYLECVQSNTFPQTDYFWAGAQIVKRQNPNYRFLEIAYNGEGRVSELRAPLGVDATPIRACSFHYNYWTKGGSGYTDVFDAESNKVRYNYNNDHRLIEIIKHEGAAQPYSSERLFWASNQSVDATCLLARSYGPYAQSPIYMRHYVYDSEGNITSDRLFGNLTGKNTQPIQLNGENIPICNGVECYNTEYRYNSRSLVTHEIKDGVDTEYVYEGETNLIKARYVWFQGCVRARNFYRYDDNGALIEEIEDDGYLREVHQLEGVTERRIKRVHNRDTAPIGLPSWIHYYYFDLSTHCEVFVKKILNHYNEHGYLVCSETYPADLPAFAEKRVYDSRGNLLEERNALNESIQYHYDENNNLIFKQGHNKEFYTQYSYDYMNRKIKEENVYSNGERHATHYEYNLLGQNTAIIDVFGNKTTTKYDALGRKIQVTGTSIHYGENHVVKPVIATEYDFLSNPVKIINQEGAVTESKYTIRGLPYYVRNADGSEAWVTYNLNGTVREGISTSGERTVFTGDFLGRVILEEHFDRNNQLLYTKSATYNFFHKTSETDASGLTTYFTYDYAGHLKSVQTGESVTQYDYDSLGRTKKVITGDSVIAKEYDLLNRPVEERLEDLAGLIYSKTIFHYDEEGRIIRTITDIDGKTSINESQYDAFGAPMLVIDALGNRTVTVTSRSHVNEYGEVVKSSETTSPDGVKVLSIYNTQGQVAAVERRDPFGNLIQKQQLFYNLEGNQTQCIDTVLPKDNKIITEYEYDLMGRVSALIEAVHTPQQRITRYFFNSEGKKTEVIKPSGDVLKYNYDSLGRLAEDNLYRYSYDICNHPTKVESIQDHQSTFYTYDSNHRAIQETLSNGLTLKYAYDNQSRITTITLPDNSQIHYTYDPKGFKTVHRGDLTHIYGNLDAGGHRLNALLMGDVGLITYNFDVQGHLIKIGSKVFNEEIAYDSVGNIIKIIQDGDELNFGFDHLGQVIKEPDHTYSYDSNYNRLSKDKDQFEYDSLNQLVSKEYTYDQNGNCIQNKDQKYSYDILDRLTKFSNSRVEVVYDYDYSNRRQSKKVYDSRHRLLSEEKYIYVGSNEIGSTDEKNTIKELRVLGHGLGAEIGAAVLIEKEGKQYVPVHDHNGNIIVLANLDGSIASKTTYSSFGEIRKHTGITTSWGYASKRKDAESGLINFGRRYYNPSLGRWLTADPLGYTAGPNLFAYVRNSPLSNYDLYGLIDDERSFLSRAYDGFKSCCNYVKESFSSGVDMVRDGLRVVGDVAKEAIRQIVPIPMIKDPLRLVVHLGTLQNPSTYRVSRKTPSHIGTLVGRISKLVPTGCGNGINNDHEEATDNNIALQEDLDGQQLSYGYNEDDGIVANLIKQVFVYLHLALPVVEQCTERVKNDLKGATYTVQFAHSQYGLILYNATKNLPPEDKSRIILVLIGTTAIVPKTEGYAMVINVVCENDIVTYVDALGRLDAARNPDNYNIISMKTYGNGSLHNHGFRNQAYTIGRRQAITEVRTFLEGKGINDW